MAVPVPVSRSPHAAVRLGGLRNRLQRVWPLWRLLALREFRVRYRQSALNAAWSLITPIAVMTIYGVILHSALGVNGDGLPYLSFAWSGVVVWTFFSQGLGTALGSLVGSADLMSKVYFPREAIPLSMVGATVIDLFIGMLTVVALALIQGVGITITCVAVVVPLAMIIVWTAALAVFGSVITVFLRDVNHATQLALRVGFFATPVMYPASRLPDSLQWTVKVNPAAVAIEAVRDTVLRHVWPDWPLVLAQLVAGIAMFVASIYYTRSVEGRVVDVV